MRLLFFFFFYKIILLLVAFWANKPNFCQPAKRWVFNQTHHSTLASFSWMVLKNKTSDKTVTSHVFSSLYYLGEAAGKCYAFFLPRPKSSSSKFTKMHPTVRQLPLLPSNTLPGISSINEDFRFFFFFFDFPKEKKLDKILPIAVKLAYTGLFQEEEKRVLLP